MARKTPARDAKGRFKPKAKRAPAKRKRNPARKRATTARKRAPAKRSYRRNPVRGPQVFTMLKDGGIAAGQVLLGKAVVRSVPQLVNLPQQGNAGLAIQAAMALAAGYVSSMFLSRGAAAAIMAGGLTAPIETLIVANNVPWIGQALSPTTSQNAVSGYMGAGRYPQPRGGAGTGVGRYPRPAVMAGYPESGPDGYDHSHDEY